MYVAVKRAQNAHRVAGAGEKFVHSHRAQSSKWHLLFKGILYWRDITWKPRILIHSLLFYLNAWKKKSYSKETIKITIAVCSEHVPRTQWMHSLNMHRYRVLATRFEVVRLNNSGHTDMQAPRNTGHEAQEAWPTRGLGHAPPGKFGILCLVRSYLMQFWGKI